MLYFWTVASLAVGALMRTTAGLSMVGLISSSVYFVEWTRLELQTDSRQDAGFSILMARTRAPADTLLGGRSHRLYLTKHHD